MQTGSTSVWSGLVSDLRDLGVDYARAKLIDVESSNDDKNIRDKAALSDNSLSSSTVAGAVVPTWVLGGAVLLVVGAIVYKLVKR